MDDAQWRQICVCTTTDETKMCAEKLAYMLAPGDSIALIGGLGAGKTQFTKGIASALGITEEVQSPTFNIENVYMSGDTEIRHFDLYRLDDVDELEDIGFYESTDETSGGISVIEWADKFLSELPEDIVYIKIEAVCDGESVEYLDGCFDSLNASIEEIEASIKQTPRKISVFGNTEHAKSIIARWIESVGVDAK